MMIRSELEKKANAYLQKKLKRFKRREEFVIKIGKCVHDVWDFELVDSVNCLLNNTTNFASKYKNAVDVLVSYLFKGE